MAPALFFDLDGTLVDTEPQHWEAWRDTLGPLGVDFSWPQYAAEAIGRSDPDLMAAIAGQQPDRFVQVDLRTVLAAKRKRFSALVKHRSPIQPDMSEVLRLIARWDLALVTSSTQMETFAILEGAGLSTHFKAIVCLDDVQNPKPDPEPYVLAKRRLAVSHGFAFEDSAAGRMSARAAGLEVFEISAPFDVCSIIRAQFLPHY